ncbi:hypothetical protein GGTG_03139 [Gaeumannomyces tritici R3-111a-1]|uniref:Arrestin n=1 Tax=Gaeumannomyces tritici (strain R3-111a-1) TaxID=644352 RepID=J3NPD1_GAET3|nr:hypothetical protein GGTG_03139 [Gaeumannomyces tritici R3-111a-1]EJT78036.1 hypothetical protein GGTG_03139 [Gaeumannomyces tritici R3-111a-1]
MVWGKFSSSSSASSAASSDASTIHNGSSGKISFAKFQMEIQLKNHFRSKVYNTGAPIEGDVVISTHRDVRFDSLQIILLGMARTRVEGMGAPHATTHTLLKLAMPVPQSAYPVPRVLEAGRTYRVPFNFVVPPHLTMGACAHAVDADHVRDCHLALPPTVGFWERDDLSPETARVEYCVKARVLRSPAADEAAAAHGVKLMEAAEQVTILPTFGERPPVSVGKADRLYRMAKSKTLRKNLLSSRVGRVTASATQPSAVFLRADGLAASETAARVRLEFEPATPDAAPPRVTAVSAKLAAYTFYSSTAMTSLPDLVSPSPRSSAVLDRRASYATTVPLFSAHVDGFRWEQRPRHQARRDSGYSSAADLDGARKSSASPVLHTCDIEVPVRLPCGGGAKGGRGKTFIPSFSSCIVSRVYVLQLSVALAGSGSATLSLRLPIQVAAEAAAGLGMAEEELPDFETALEEAEADRHLRPRVLSVPDHRFVETSELPGYD